MPQKRVSDPDKKQLVRSIEYFEYKTNRGFTVQALHPLFLGFLGLYYYIVRTLIQWNLFLSAKVSFSRKTSIFEVIFGVISSQASANRMPTTPNATDARAASLERR
jgi:hypothetical protein